MQQQLVEKVSKKIPGNFKVLVYTHEQEKGLLLSYDQFRKGKFVEASEAEKFTLLTTMLLGSGTFLYQYLKSNYPDFNLEVIKPNGFTSASFEVKYTFGGNEIFVMRFMRDKTRLLIPMAAENPENYSLMYGFDVKEVGKLTEILNELSQYFKQNNIAYEILRDRA